MFWSCKNYNIGVSIVSSIKFKNFDSQLLKQVVNKANSTVFNIRTTAISVIKSIFKESCNTAATCISYINLRKLLNIVLNFVVKKLRKISKTSKNKAQIAKVTTISAYANKELRNSISDLFARIGLTAVLSVKEVKTLNHKSEFVDGLKIDCK